MAMLIGVEAAVVVAAAVVVGVVVIVVIVVFVVVVAFAIVDVATVAGRPTSRLGSVGDGCQGA